MKIFSNETVGDQRMTSLSRNKYFYHKNLFSLQGNNNRQNHKNAYENKTQNMDQIFQEKLRLSILFRERRERIGKICEREGGKNPEIKKANSLSG